MPTYKFTYITGSYFLKAYPDLATAQADAPEDYTVAESDETIIELTIGQKLEMDEIFGMALKSAYLEDNRKVAEIRGFPFTPAETDSMLAKFQKMLNYCIVGSIRQIAEELPGIDPDEIFTEARKQKYIQMVADHLAQYE